MKLEQRLPAAERILDSGLDPQGAAQVLELMGASHFPPELLEENCPRSEGLPENGDFDFTPEQWLLHFLWEALDRLPMGSVADFAIPCRRLLAARLFRRCGKHLIAAEDVRFNYGHRIEVGDDVFLNRGVFLDCRGGIVLGNGVHLAEGVEILTRPPAETPRGAHAHDRVVIGDFARVYARAAILPGVTIGENAVVAAEELVSEDVAADGAVADAGVHEPALPGASSRRA